MFNWTDNDKCIYNDNIYCRTSSLCDSCMHNIFRQNKVIQSTVHQMTIEEYLYEKRKESKE